MVNRVFVYGTLKRGQIRERRWPHSPVQVVAAKIRGRLYDLGSYPALWTGNDWVGGEVWKFAVEHMPATLAVLDEIEGYANSPQDLYQRVIVNCITESVDSVQAFAYRYRDASILNAAQVSPKSPGDACIWPLLDTQHKAPPFLLEGSVKPLSRGGKGNDCCNEETRPE